MRSASSRRAAAAEQDAGSVLQDAAALSFIAAGVLSGVNRKSNAMMRERICRARADTTHLDTGFTWT
jgi:hypothetical protein